MQLRQRGLLHGPQVEELVEVLHTVQLLHGQQLELPVL
jgi:hypothetical protein